MTTESTLETARHRTIPAEEAYFQRETAEIMAALRRELAAAHIEHDFGKAAKAYLVGKYGDEILARVLEQRQALAASGTLYAPGEKGEELIGRLNLRGLLEGLGPRDMTDAEARLYAPQPSPSARLLGNLLRGEVGEDQRTVYLESAPLEGPESQDNKTKPTQPIGDYARARLVPEVSRLVQMLRADEPRADSVDGALKRLKSRFSEQGYTQAEVSYFMTRLADAARKAELSIGQIIGIAGAPCYTGPQPEHIDEFIALRQQVPGVQEEAHTPATMPHATRRRAELEAEAERRELEAEGHETFTPFITADGKRPDMRKGVREWTKAWSEAVTTPFKGGRA